MNIVGISVECAAYADHSTDAPRPGFDEFPVERAAYTRSLTLIATLQPALITADIRR